MAMNSTPTACEFFSPRCVFLKHQTNNMDSTPWLTTRRRTCPICKGDVVRSMARGSWAGPRYEPYHDDGEDDDDQVAEGSGSRSSSTDEDLEQGVAEAEPTAARRSNWQDNFFFILPGGRRRAQSPPPPSEDRQT